MRNRTGTHAARRVWLYRIFSVFITASILGLLTSTTALAQGSLTQNPGDRDRVSSYKVEIHFDKNSDLIWIVENITYEFGKSGNDSWFQRIIPDSHSITDVSVRATPAPHGVDVRDTDSGVRIRVGYLEHQNELTGKHTYTISYQVHGITNSTKNGMRLEWNAVGSDWNVPVNNITVKVFVPESSELSGYDCYADNPGDTGPCDRIEVKSGTLSVFQERLIPGQTLRVELALTNSDSIDSGSDSESSGALFFFIGLGILILLGIAAVVYPSRSRSGGPTDRRPIGTSIDPHGYSGYSRGAGGGGGGNGEL